MSGEARKLIVLSVIVILLLTAINLTAREGYRITFVEDFVLTIFSPLQNFFARIGSRVGSFFYTVVNYRAILEEVETLRAELASRRELAGRILELQKENYRLRLLLGFKSQTDYELLPAEVIARDPHAWFETITVNKGYQDGVEKDMSVVTDSGLVGKVLKVSRYSSQVMLLTDPRLGVSALVQRSRDPGIVGIVEGYPEEPGYLKMTNIPPEANILPGDAIISSGLGGVFPKALIIGHVLEVGEDEYGLLQYALLKPAVDFNRLEEVFLVFRVETEIPSETDEADETGEQSEELHTPGPLRGR